MIFINTYSTTTAAKASDKGTYVDPHIWMEAINSIGLPIEGITFEPTSLHTNVSEVCWSTMPGLKIRIQDRDSIQPYRCGIAMLIAAAKSLSERLRLAERTSRIQSRPARNRSALWWSNSSKCYRRDRDDRQPKPANGTLRKLVCKYERSSCFTRPRRLEALSFLLSKRVGILLKLI